MSTLSRVTAKLFGGSAPLDEIGQFGSALAGTKYNTQDVAEIQALDAYDKGWGSAVISSRNFPPVEEVTGVLKTLSYQNCYLLQEGIPAYDSGTEYSNTSIVKSISGTTLKFFISLANNNKGNPLTDNTKWAEAVLNSGRNIGEIITSTIPLTDAGLHLLDGTLLSGTGSYAEFVSYIASIYNSALNYFCTEAEWQASVTTYGVCGKFVYDSINNTVRLPKITGIVEGTTDTSALGDLIEAGLPNITGAFDTSARDGWYSDGAFYSMYRDNKRCAEETGASITWFLDASRSSSIYGNSTTVQPQTIKVLYYIVIATTAKTDIEVDIDEIATDLNGKADTDLANIDNSGGIKIAHSASPSNTKIKDYTLGASGATYTMTADGIFNLKVMGSALGNFQVFNTSKPTSTYQVGGVVMGNGYWAGWVMPVSKGDILQIDYQTVPSAYGLTLMYATGSESEA